MHWYHIVMVAVAYFGVGYFSILNLKNHVFPEQRIACWILSLLSACAPLFFLVAVAWHPESHFQQNVVNWVMRWLAQISLLAFTLLFLNADLIFDERQPFKFLKILDARRSMIRWAMILCFLVDALNHLRWLGFDWLSGQYFPFLGLLGFGFWCLVNMTALFLISSGLVILMEEMWNTRALKRLSQV